jgi:energy-coupling factor transport system permease protein
MIELSRDITFGQYVNNGSALSQMDPRTKLVCTVLLIAVFSYANSFIAFAACLLMCVVIQWASHIPLSYALRSFKPVVIILPIVYIIQVVLYVSPPTQHITLFWHWWIFSLSSEGILFSTQAIVRVIFLYYITFMLLFVTSLVDLTDGLEALFSPLQKIGIPVNPLVMVLVIAFKFVPILVKEVERLIKAQSARGVRFDKGNFVQRTLKIAPLLIPLFINGFKRAETLSIAMEARCYGTHRGWRRSKRRELHFIRFDALVLAITLLFCAATVLINLFAPF